MNIKSIPIYIFSAAVVLAFMLNCQSNKTSNSDKEYEIIDPRSLVVHHEDLSVLLALKNDTLYRAIEDSLVEVEGMDITEAEQAIQSMIDNGIIMKPILGYYDDKGYQSKELKYRTFKKYIAIIKDSIQGKEVKLDSSNFPFPQKPQKE